MNDQNASWWPLATSAQLGTDRPLARQLLGLPLVLFRDAQGRAVAQLDRCPHRHAPLSGGCVRDGQLTCAYHGWRFDGDGKCTRVPGLPKHEASNKPLNRVVATTEVHGMVWACLQPAAETMPAAAPAEHEQNHDVFFITSTLVCGMQEAAENFLDGFHTHFVHAGWIRRDAQRQKVAVRVTRLFDGVQAHYSGEGRQSGLVSRLFESERSVSMGRFRLPCLAEIEYRGASGLNLLASAWMTPEAPGRLRIHVRIATRRGLAPAWLKQLVLRRLFGVILRQDRAILERTAINAARFDDGAACLDSPLDLLGPHIRRLLAGQSLDGFDEREITVSL